jgi:hypothetical protein
MDKKRRTLRGREPKSEKRLWRALVMMTLALVTVIGGRLAVADDAEYKSIIRPGGSPAQMEAASVGCKDCHTKTDAPTMHQNPAVHIGCAECHGGDPNVRAQELSKSSPLYTERKNQAHVLPKHPENWPTSANPKHSYTDLLKESVEFARFVNPGDLRAAPAACGGCHSEITTAVKKSLMTTSAMFWGGAAYNNGILPYKNYLLGESYTQHGEPASIVHDGRPLTKEMRARGALEKLLPLPTWEVMPPADIFRVFERGGMFVKSQFAEIGVPNPLEEPGKPDVKASNRGPGTGARIAVPVINIHKTRLNDPHLSFLGTNDHPGDYRSSGCTACHTIYANDRDPRHSGPYAKFGHEGKTQTIDPTIPKNEEGHPLKHLFTRSIPTSQCMVCHMHQPNMFVNTYVGYTMWDYESDAPFMWPEKQRYPTTEETYKSLEHNPEEAAIRGKWTDVDFLKRVSDLNPKLNTTQFADYHGHGWNFRAVHKRDRKGHLLDKDGKIVSFDDPEKFKKAVHLQDIHVDFGMQCVDCHFSQDAHGDGNIYGEVAQAVEITCDDCHGSVKGYATLKTSGPAAADGGRDLSTKRTPWGERQFVWKDDGLYQRSLVTEGLEWRVKQVKDSVTPGNPHYNAKSAKAKLVKKIADGADTYTMASAKDASDEEFEEKLAHPNSDMSCFSCHSSWTTACGGCHLPIQANWKKTTNHYEGKLTRNWATYNPQVARDDMYQLGRHGPAKKGKIVPVRSSSALVLSSTDSNRQKIYIQQPPTSAAGYSSQAFAPHFPHTVRTKETKDCKDCHLSKDNDNNAILAQLMLLGTNFVNFMGYYTWLASADGGVEAVQVTEWDEPQAVIGSYLHRYAYPDYYKAHQAHGLELQESHAHHGVGDKTYAIQMRGEYLYTAAGSDGFRVYDIANIANKGFSERIVTSSISPLGQNIHVPSKNATGLALPTTMPVAPFKKQLPENLETPMHAIYHYAFIADSEEGLIVVNVDTLQDGEPRNNFLERALTWNEDDILSGARNISLAGARAFVGTEDKVVVINLEDPLSPRVEATWPANKPTAVAVQFRYAFMTDGDGFKVIDITSPEKPRIVSEGAIALPDARNVYVARTYAYVSGGREGLVIIDIEKPENPFVYEKFGGKGVLTDTYDVKVATTNASLIGYAADGENGLVVLQMTDPERVPGFYGFSPPVKPKVIAKRKTRGPAIAISKPLDRDRAVDETGNQVSVLGRLGSRPFTLEEMRKMFLTEAGKVWTVE